MLLVTMLTGFAFFCVVALITSSVTTNEAAILWAVGGILYALIMVIYVSWEKHNASMERQQHLLDEEEKGDHLWRDSSS